MLHPVTKQGCKPLPIKVDLGTDVNTIPPQQVLWTLFPSHFMKAGNLKPHTLKHDQLQLGPANDNVNQSPSSDILQVNVQCNTASTDHPHHLICL